MNLNHKSKIAAAILSGALAVGVIGGIAFAQTPTPGTPSGFNFAQAFEKALATKLGITTDVLTQDYKSAAKDAVAQALKAGEITQAQADQMNQRIDQEQGLVMPFGRFDGGRGGFPGGVPGNAPGAVPGSKDASVLTAAATALNMQLSDLQTQLRAGQTIAQVAASKNVPVSQVVQAVVNAENAAIDQAVKNGKLTADQATQAKQMAQQRATDLVNGTFSGRRGGPGGPRGRFNGLPGAQNGTSQPQPSTQSQIQS